MGLNFTLDFLCEEFPEFCPESDISVFLLEPANLELVLFLLLCSVTLAKEASGTISIGLLTL